MFSRLIYTELLGKGSIHGRRFISETYQKNPNKFPVVAEKLSYGQIVDVYIQEGMPRNLKFRFNLWINAQYGAQTRNVKVILERVIISDGINVDHILKQCWPELQKILQNPNITVCNI